MDVSAAIVLGSHAAYALDPSDFFTEGINSSDIRRRKSRSASLSVIVIVGVSDLSSDNLYIDPSSSVMVLLP